MQLLRKKVSEAELVLLLLCGTGVAFMLGFVLPVLLARALYPVSETHHTSLPPQRVHELPSSIRTLRLVPIWPTYTAEWLHDLKNENRSPGIAVWINKDHHGREISILVNESHPAASSVREQ